jgi:hypothetical protein
MHIEPPNTTYNRVGVSSSNKADFLFEIKLIVVKRRNARDRPDLGGAMGYFQMPTFEV